MTYEDSKKFMEHEYDPPSNESIVKSLLELLRIHILMRENEISSVMKGLTRIVEIITVLIP